jgi:hypothetical protein
MGTAFRCFGGSGTQILHLRFRRRLAQTAITAVSVSCRFLAGGIELDDLHCFFSMWH